MNNPPLIKDAISAEIRKGRGERSLIASSDLANTPID